MTVAPICASWPSFILSSGANAAPFSFAQSLGAQESVIVYVSSRLKSRGTASAVANIVAREMIEGGLSDTRNSGCNDRGHDSANADSDGIEKHNGGIGRYDGGSSEDEELNFDFEAMAQGERPEGTLTLMRRSAAASPFVFRLFATTFLSL